MNQKVDKTIFILLMLSCLAIFCNCQKIQEDTPLPVNLNAVQVIKAIENNKLPISKIEFYTSETDYEKLLGKPNQYIEKVDWIDTRIKGNSTDNLIGGSIEVFENAELVYKRKKEWLNKELNQGFKNYYIENKNVLMILDGSLNQEQIFDYEKAIKSL